MLWLFFIVRIAYNIAFAKVIQDVRSDDEESEEEKEGDGAQVGIAGPEVKEKRSNGRAVNGRAANGRAANGKALKPKTEAMVERKKER